MNRAEVMAQMVKVERLHDEAARRGLGPACRVLAARFEALAWRYLVAT